MNRDDCGIFDLPHHVPKNPPPMSMCDLAAQFHFCSAYRLRYCRTGDGTADRPANRPGEPLSERLESIPENPTAAPVVGISGATLHTLGGLFVKRLSQEYTIKIKKD